MRILITLIILLLCSPVYAERFFEKHNTFYEPIPAGATVSPSSDAYINDILSNVSWLQFVYYRWAMPIWEPPSGTANVTVTMDNPSGTCGSNAVANGWNIIPIPTDAKSAGMDDWCRNSNDGGLTTSAYRDMHMIVMSADGKWEWDLFKARNCEVKSAPGGDDDGICEAGETCSGWRASCLRKRARTTADTPTGTWDGSGVGTVFSPSAGVYSQDDLMGNTRACGQVATSHGLITYDDYLSGVIDHALIFGYYGEKKYPDHWGHYPCLSYRQGLVERDNAMYLGRRLQLKTSYNCNALTNAFQRMTCVALQTYGAIFVINVGPGYNNIYMEGIDGKNDFWSGIVSSFPVPISTTNWQIVESVCDNPNVCPNTVGYGDTTAPTVPANLACTAHATLQEITCTWDASTDAVGVVGYHVYRDTDNYAASISSPETDRSYTNGGLTASTQYCYKVDAYDAAGNTSAKSTAACDTTPALAETTYTIKKNPAGQAITVDGDCTEFQDANSLTVTPASGGNELTLKLLWDSTGLYWCGTVTDTEINAVAVRDGGLWSDDSVAILLDTANDGGSSQDSDDFKLYISAANVQEDQNAGSRSWSTTWTSAVVLTGSLNSNIDTDTSYVLEGRVTWANLGISAPTGGVTNYGFDVELNDSDAAGLYTKAWENADGGTINNPSGWGLMAFSNTEVTPGTPTMVLKSVKSSGGDYTSMQACVAGQAANLVTNNTYVICEAQGAFEDTTAVDVTGYTTDADHYIELRAKETVRHAGIYSTSAYRIKVTGEPAITIQEGHVRIKDLQVYSTNASANAKLIHVNTTDTAGITIQRNILRMDDAAQTGRSVILLAGGAASSVVNIEHNLIYGLGASNGELAIKSTDADITAYVDYNTIVSITDALSSGSTSSGTLEVNPVTADSYVTQSSGNSNQGTNTQILVKNNASANVQRRGILRFDFTSLNDGATITGSTMSAYYRADLSTSCNSLPVLADRLTTTGWTETGITWNCARDDNLDGSCDVSWTTAGGDYTTTNEATGTTPSATGWTTWNVLNQVQAAQSGAGEVYHALLRRGIDSGTISCSFESDDATNKPKLSIDWELSSTGGPIVFRNNLVYGATTSSFTGSAGSGNNCTDMNFDFAGSNNLKSQTITFRDSTNGNYNLRRGSACLSGGSDLGYTVDLRNKAIRYQSKGALDYRGMRIF